MIFPTQAAHVVVFGFGFAALRLRIFRLPLFAFAALVHKVSAR
jgi:hypothetical protein